MSDAPLITHGVLGDPDLEIGPDGVPRSARFGDIYYSAQDGLAETRHTFLQGVQAEALFTEGPVCLAETGFGTGLNMLACWAAWRLGPRYPLDLVSVEGMPLAPDQLAQALAPWRPALGSLVDRLLCLYPAPRPGMHRLRLEPGLSLTLVLADVAAGLAQMSGPVDAWFLDGFAPSRNPAMWTDRVLAQVARLSRAGTRLATFTAAGAVRRGLEAVGFAMARRPGFGTKREHLVGTFTGQGAADAPPWVARPAGVRPRTALVVGAGIAGAATADALGRRGWQVTVLDRNAAPAQEASGNPVGLVVPRLTVDASPAGRLYGAAHGFARRLYGSLDIPQDWTSGALMVARSPADEARFERLTCSGLWPPDGLRLLSPEEASDVAGVSLSRPALHVREGGWISPPAAVAALLAPHACLYDAPLGSIRRTQEGQWQALDPAGGVLAQAAALVLTGGVEGLLLLEADARPVTLEARRGQVTAVPATPWSRGLRVPLSFGHYLTPSVDGYHLVGATFDPVRLEPGVGHQQAVEADDARNLEALAEGLGVAFAHPKPDLSRAAVRAATPDRLPLVGAVPDLCHARRTYGQFHQPHAAALLPPVVSQPGLFVLTGLGARGLTTAPLMGELVASLAEGAALPLAWDLYQAVHPLRFTLRALKRA